MDFFQVRHSISEHENGRFPQVQTAIYPVPTEHPHFSGNLWFQKADPRRVIFPVPILMKGAKLTDYISCFVMGTSFRMLVSDKLKLILEDSLHREMQFFPATVIYRGEENRDYWFTNHYNFSNNLIDFKRSEIWRDGGATQKKHTAKLNIQSFEEYLEAEKEIKPPVGLSFKHIELIEPIHEEFFTLRWAYGSMFYVNSDLKQRIEDAGCTGIQFMGINERL